MQQKNIIITAPEIYGKKLKSVLEKYNFKVSEFPTIETVLFDNPEYSIFYREIHTFDYIILPSRNAIKSFVHFAEKYSVKKEILQNLNYATIGKDYEYLNRFGLQNTLKTDEPSTTGIFEALKNIKQINKLAVISPKVKIIKEPDIIPEFIMNLQTISSVKRIDGYITQPVKNPDQNIIKKILNSDYDLIAFTSGAEAEALKYLFNDKTDFSILKVACFGPFTASAVQKTGIKPEITGSNFNSFEDFAETLKIYFKTVRF